MKKCLSLFFIVFFCLICFSAYGAEELPIDVLYHGKSIDFDSAPYYLNGRIMVPVRAIFESLGADVDWDESTNTANAVLDDTEVSLTLGQNIITINSMPYEMDAPVEMQGDRIFAPARYVAESFGKKISYHDYSHTAIISDSNEYDFYPGLTRPVPRLDWVDGVSVYNTSHGANGGSIYTYTGDENSLTEYINFLQLDFGYSIYNMEYLSDSVRYTYILDELKISVTEWVDNNGIYGIEIIPDVDLIYKSDEPIQPEVTKEHDDVISYDDVNYGTVTGAVLSDTYTDDGIEYYIYKYSPFEVAMYESFIESNGWTFYDFNIDIDTFSNMKYWEKDGTVLCVSTNHFYGVVMVAVISG